MATRSYKILLVDDDQLLRDMYRVKFSEQGHEITVSGSGEEALRLLDQGLLPDIIVFDLIMPGFDGFALLQELQKKKIGNPILIVLSNQDQQMEKERAIALGANGYIAKASAIPSEVLKEIIAIADTHRSMSSEPAT